MNAFEDERLALPGPFPPRRGSWGGMAVAGFVFLGVGIVMVLYNACKIEVGTGQQAVLIRREGQELEPDMEVAPPPKDGKIL